MQRLAQTWSLLLLLAALLTLGLALTNVEDRLDDRADAIEERERAFLITRPFQRLQRETLNLLALVAGGEAFTTTAQLSIQRDITESRFYNLTIGRNINRMTPPLAEVFYASEALWLALQADLNAYMASDLQDTALQARLVASIKNLELAINQADNVHTVRVDEIDSNLLHTESALSQAALWSAAAFVFLMLMVFLNFYRFSRQAYQSRLAAQQAAESNRVKSQFLANMSHELRTPLNAILNFTDFVVQGVYGAVNAEQKDALGKSLQSGYQLLSLINNILDISKIEAGMMERFIEEIDLNQVLDEVFATAQGLISEGHQISLHQDVQPNLPNLHADKLQVRQILLNLLSNAIKFTIEGRVTLHARQEGDSLLVSIHDTGIGIPPESQSLIFEEFQQVKSARRGAHYGTGLGLAISKHFAEMQGGKLWVESQAGQGSTFYVRLPLGAVS